MQSWTPCSKMATHLVQKSLQRLRSDSMLARVLLQEHPSLCMHDLCRSSRLTSWWLSTQNNRINKLNHMVILDCHIFKGPTGSYSNYREESFLLVMLKKFIFQLLCTCIGFGETACLASSSTSVINTLYHLV